MKSLFVVPLLALASFVACSSSSSKNGSSGACTETKGGNVVLCLSWTNLTTDESSGLCNGDPAASACPAAGAIGTCAYSYPSGGGTFSYEETYYANGGSTCAELKAGCASIGAVTATFTGNGC
jgi:hypothetical protein